MLILYLFPIKALHFPPVQLKEKDLFYPIDPNTQIPVEKWHGLIGESTIADAILNRVTFSSHRVELTVESYRRKMKLES